MQTNTQEDFLQQYRCQSCNKLLFKGSLVISTVEIKCRKCGMISLFNVLDNNKQRDDMASFLVNSQGVIVNAGALSPAMGGQQRSLIGTRLSALFNLLGAKECTQTIEEALHGPVSHQVSEFQEELEDGQTISLKWHFIKRGAQTFVHIRLRLNVTPQLTPEQVIVSELAPAS